MLWGQACLHRLTVASPTVASQCEIKCGLAEVTFLLHVLDFRFAVRIKINFKFSDICFLYL